MDTSPLPARSSGRENATGGPAPTTPPADVDPRRLVAIAGLVALLLGAGAFGLLWGPAHRSAISVHHVAASLDRPKEHLVAATRASNDAQGALTAAAAATGGDRARLLAAAVADAQLVSAAWTKYDESAAGLPGEQRLAARYRTDQRRAQAASSTLLVPIVTSAVGGTLPTGQIQAHERVRGDLMALYDLYRDADRAALGSLDADAAHFEGLLVGLGVVGAAIVMFATVAAFRRARLVTAEREVRREAAQLAEFEARLRRALELVDSDDAAFAVAGRALREVVPDAATSLLVADSSRARLVAVDERPSCQVESVDACPAMRAGTTLIFPDSGQLGTCPVLEANAEGPCSATCVPITVAGRGAALMHLSGCVGDPPDRHGATDLVARSVGERVTLLQAFATFQLQAERDPLTGLLNRRSLETAIARTIDPSTRYAVAFGDLDHFKRLNDVHGHDAGDRALRAFSRVLRESLRPEDLCCRWGGEEFVVVLPSCDAALADEAMGRVRTNLALGSIGAQTSAVTVSFGVADSAGGDTFDDVVEHADVALREAKSAGRNRTVIWDPTGGRAALGVAGATHPATDAAS
jgi:diguanylate cyclase (GGDEF)-like protein